MGDPLPPPSPMPAGTWAADPWGRHQLRWFDGAQWTAHVCNNGVLTDDDGTAPTPPPPPNAPSPAGVPSLPAAPRQPTPIAHQAPFVHHGPAVVPHRKRRRGATAVKVVASVVVGLLVVSAATAMMAGDDDSQDGAGEADGPAPAASSMNVVPVQLGPEATHRERPVDAASFGDEWPLTVDSGTVVCEAVPAPLEVQYVLFVDPAGAVYAVNGTARGALESQGWFDFETIWKDHPDEFVPKVNVGPLIQAGLEICEPAPITDAPVSDVLEPDTIDAIVGIVWEMATPEERVGMCEGWRADPELMRAVFISEAGTGDPAYWPPLERRLQDGC